MDTIKQAMNENARANQKTKCSLLHRRAGHIGKNLLVLAFCTCGICGLFAALMQPHITGYYLYEAEAFSRYSGLSGLLLILGAVGLFLRQRISE